jgi:hypothetical protein
MKRSRSIISEPTAGGASCEHLSEVSTCNTADCPVDCVYTQWSTWDTCSEACDGGTQSRRRSISIHADDGGSVCPTVLEESQNCNIQLCNVDCQYTWTAWSTCTQSCKSATATGTQSRTVASVETPQRGNGAACGVQEDRVCNDHACPTDCVVPAFEAWSTCTKSCGTGTQSRSRATVEPSAGGVACPHSAETRNCNDYACPVDCKWEGAWTAYSTCTKSCGTTGSQSRSRVFVDGEYGGKHCAPHTAARACNVHACPVNCVIAPSFGAWSTCTKSCGDGSQFRTKALTAPTGGGAPCPATQHESVYETRSCNDHLCPINCVVSAWGGWDTCSVACGPGIKARTRTITVTPKHGGTRCPDLVDEEDCAGPVECPVDCVFEWDLWSTCSATCGGGMMQRELVVTTWALHNGVPCPSRQDRTCNSHACPTPAPTSAPTPTTAAPTPAPTPRPFSKPILFVLQGDDLHLEATTEDNYVDAGATCTDLIDGNLNRAVRVSGDVVNLARPGAYHIKYDCANHEGIAAYQAERIVYVEDNTCPVCQIIAGPPEIEASFPYADPGVSCYDTVDGAFSKSSIVVSGLPDVDQVGEYTITYRVQDSAGNWNDGAGTNCAGAAQYKRTVEVVDSLKPVLALRLTNPETEQEYTVQMSAVADESSGTPLVTTVADEDGSLTYKDATYKAAPAAYRPANPAYTSHPAYPVSDGLMAEQQEASVNSWVLAAAAAAVAGLAMLALSKRARTVAVEV